jgi:hypothetical protein
MLTRRAWLGLAFYLGACAWVCFRTAAGYPVVPRGVLAIVAGR